MLTNFTAFRAYILLLIICAVGVAGARAQPGTALPAQDDSTQVRVRELIYVLRQYRPSERSDEWGSAIRELAKIGKPALPELLLELKNTEREPTFEAMLFTLRAIDDPRALPFVIDEIPKVERRWNQSSDNRVYFTDPKLDRFMHQSQFGPDDHGDFITYGGPIDEILGTLHKLSRTEYEDSWDAAFWRNWWTAQQSSGKADKQDPSLTLAPRTEDLVERDGLHRYGVLFRTGPSQFLSPAMEVQFADQVFANAPCALDIETGRIYEWLEGVRYAPMQKGDPFEVSRWQDQNRIDIRGEYVSNVHLWLIDNSRWESLDAEIASGKPLNMGRETFEISERDNNTQGKGVGTFLFTTGEGSRGVMRVEHLDDAKATKYEYRLWNRREPIELRARPDAAGGKAGTWQSAKLVLLNVPEFDIECMFDFKQGKKVVLPRSVLDQKLPDLQTIRKTRGQLFNDWRIALWAEKQGIDLVVNVVHNAGTPFEPDARPRREIGYVVLRAARQSRVNEEAFEKLSVVRAKEILDRRPHLFQITMMASDEPGELASTWLFNTKAGVVGLLRILKLQDNAVGFEYKLADE